MLEDLADLSEQVRGTEPRDVLLIIDHLDRLLHTPHERYWFEELSTLSKRVTWLHVIAACRPEEYDTVVSFAMAGSLAKAKFAERRAGPLMAHVDSQGRATARGVETEIRGTDEDLHRLGHLALSMRLRRFLDRPGVTSDATFAGAPILTFAHGRVRIIHDAVQDFLCAWALARDLAVEDDSGDSVRRLLDAPPDVLRMLLGILTTSRRLARADRVRAARGFARGILREATLRHWLYDTGYLARARENVEQFASAFSGEPAVSGVAQLLLGLLEYSELSVTQLEPGRNETSVREAARGALGRAIDALSTALAQLDRANLAVDTRDVEVAVVYVADHLLTLLARASALAHSPVAEEMRERALDKLADVVGTAGTGALTPGWAKSLVTDFDPRDVNHIAPLVRMDGALSVRMSDAEGRRRFALRSFQLAGHIGGTLFLYPKHDSASLREGERWQERAVTRVHRVLRDMEDLGGDEHFGSRAHGLMDAARALASIVFFRMVALKEGVGPPLDGKYSVLEAFDRYESARKLAKLALRPGERLTTANWHGMQDQVFGGTFKKAFFAGGMTAEQAKSALDHEEASVLEENRRYAQRNPRSAHHPMLEHVKARIGEPAEFIARFGRPGT